MRMQRTGVIHVWMYALIALVVFGCAGDDVAPVDVENRAFDDLRTEVRAVIDDSNRQSEVLRLIDELQQDLVALRARVSERKVRARKLNANYDTTREEFEAFLASVEAEVREHKRRVSETHRELFAIVTPEERAVIAKSHSKAMKATIKSIQSI